MVFNFLEGNFEEAKKMQLESLPLIKALFSEVNPIPVKEALNIIGFDFGIPRLPLTKISLENKILLQKLLHDDFEDWN